MSRDPESLALAEHEGLVQHICARYSQHPDFEDILQLARLGLLNALRKYDPQRGKLSTFAAYYIRREVLEFFYLGQRKKRLSPFVEMSLDAPYGEHDLLGDTIGLDDPSYAQIDARLQCERLLVLVDPRARNILIHRAKGYSLSQLGKRYGISKERIRQIERDGTKKIRKGIALSEHV